MSHLGLYQGPDGLNWRNHGLYAGSSRIVRTEVYQGYALQKIDVEMAWEGQAG